MSLNFLCMKTLFTRVCKETKQEYCTYTHREHACINKCYALETFDLPKTDHDVPVRLVMGIETENNIHHEQETAQQSTQMLTPEQTHVYKSSVSVHR